MPVINQDVRNRFPEFASLTSFPDARIDPCLQEAIRNINRDHFEERADDATLWLCAHLLTLSSSARGSGAQAVGAGSARINFAQAFGPGSLELTYYGRRYQELARLGGGARLAVVP